ncbi:hypothetical protein D3C74_316990 [compost metagenome]
MHDLSRPRYRSIIHRHPYRSVASGGVLRRGRDDAVSILAYSALPLLPWDGWRILCDDVGRIYVHPDLPIFPVPISASE